MEIEGIKYKESYVFARMMDVITDNATFLIHCIDPERFIDCFKESVQKMCHPPQKVPEILPVKTTHYMDKKNPAVKINNIAQITFNKMLVEKMGLKKYKYAKGFEHEDKIIFIFSEEKTGDTVLLVENGGGKTISCRERFFKNRRFEMEEGKVNRRLSYEFLTKNVVEIKLPPEKSSE